MQHKNDRTPKEIPRAIGREVWLACLVLVALAIPTVSKWAFRAPVGYPADFLYDTHPDHTVDWRLHIPVATWNRITSSAPAEVAKDSVQRQVINLVSQGFDGWKIEARNCFTTDVDFELDGSVRYLGRCEWGGKLDERGT